MQVSIASVELVDSRLLQWIVCPTCGNELRIEHVSSQILVCPNRHRFPIVFGVPRLLQDLEPSDDARSINESFTGEWKHFDYDVDRTWGQTIAHRRAEFLRHIDRSADWLKGKKVLDAGCGNGVLSRAIADLGCEVVATDLSQSVFAAYHRFQDGHHERLHYFQSDLMKLAVKPASFDVVYCAGVLHHTPNTWRTFREVVNAVAPGGTMFVWLYWRERGLKHRVKITLRDLTRPLPLALKRALAFTFVLQAMPRQWLRRVRQHGKGEVLNFRENFVIQLDFFTPRYRWEHSPEEVARWYRELGFTDIMVTKTESSGFGVAARKPQVSDIGARRQANAANVARHATR